MAGNAELVQQALGAMRGGDLDAARAVVADDFVWHVPGSSPIAGDAVGVDAWARKFHRILDAGLQPEILAVLEGAEHAALVQRNRADVGGHSLDVRVVNLFTIADGKLRRMDTYFADQAAVDAFWTAVMGGG